jgi:YesN/AraC family two-component response regulator
MQILLVGDAIMTPEGLQKYLGEAMLKAEIVCCPNGSTAVATAATIPQGIVIAHMNLPGSAYGSKVLQQVKEANQNIYTVLIIRTGFYQHLEKDLKMHIDHIMTPPFQKNQFRTFLRKTFRIIEDLQDHCKRREVYEQINRFLVDSTEKNRAVASSFQRSGHFIKESNLEKAKEPDAAEK